MSPTPVRPDLTVIIPVYNEEKTIEELLKKLLAVDFGDARVEVIAVDDGSSDTSSSILRKFNKRIIVLAHECNKGKGAAIRTALVRSTGTYIVIQDADLEYDPADLATMLQHMKKGNAQAVYGSRQQARAGHRNKRGRIDFYMGGVVLSALTNMLYGTHLTDEPTCYKMVAHDIYNRITLSRDGFDFCPELTAKIARLGITIEEIPISYYPRSPEEGKKIRAWDGVTAVGTLLKNRFFS